MTHALAGKEGQHLLPVVHHDVVVFRLGAVNLSLNLVSE